MPNVQRMDPSERKKASTIANASQTLGKRLTRQASGSSRPLGPYEPTGHVLDEPLVQSAHRQRVLLPDSVAAVRACPSSRAVFDDTAACMCRRRSP